MKYLHLLIGIAFYFVPVILLYIAKMPQTAGVWLAFGWIGAIGVVEYLDKN